jgi:hypothetical protein
VEIGKPVTDAISTVDAVEKRNGLRCAKHMYFSFAAKECPLCVRLLCR